MELTICSVCHSDQNRNLLEANHELTERLNPVKNWQWMVADNTPDQKLKNSIDSGKFIVVPGLTMNEIISSLPPEFIPQKAGFHHATAVNSMLKKVTTRFALVLDSDFYIVRPGWAEDIIARMKNNGLAFFDVPWNPKWFTKRRYIPASHSLFIDFSKVRPGDFDFLPLPKKKSFLAAAVKHIPLPKKIKDILEGRLKIGLSRDMGYQIYECCKSKNLKYECVQPVFKRSEKNARLAEAVIPERFSYVPKRRNSYSEKGFGELGFCDPSSLGEAEEFLWEGLPYGFHLRGHKTGLGRNEALFEEHMRKVKTILANYYGY